MSQGMTKRSAIPADDPLATALSWLQAGRRVAVATVIRTWGSAPLPAGSQLVADDSGNFAGSVSGGCIEGAVIEEAGKTIRTGRPQLLKFGVTDQRAWEIGLVCGGEIEIFVEPFQ